MSTFSKAIAAAVLLAAALFSASLYATTVTPQIGGGISQFDGGIGTLTGPVSAPPATCSGTGLIFSTACNSQYIGIL